MKCDSCLFYDPDDQLCTMILDEDDMGRFLSQKNADCPYYRDGDEYKIARRQ